jgi:hypothetical protein
VSYTVEDSAYGFSLGRYNTHFPLVIDPVLTATFVGGSDEDWGYALTLDSTGFP